MAQQVMRIGLGQHPDAATYAADTLGNAGAAVALGAGNSIGVILPVGITRDQAAQLLTDLTVRILDVSKSAVFPVT